MNAILKHNLYEKELKDFFKHHQTLESKSLIAFYQQFEPNIKPSTINWRVSHLVQNGYLSRIKKGVFAIGKGIIYQPTISEKIKTIYAQIHQRFPYLEICIWHTSILNEFMIHQLGRFYTLVETEKDGMESVFYFLRDTQADVFIKPDADIMDKYISYKKEAIIIKPLISKSPIQKLANINTITLEKMLVDIFCEKVIFEAVQGVEMTTIFQEAFSKYTINQQRMMNYAKRRGNKQGKKFDDFITKNIHL